MTPPRRHTLAVLAALAIGAARVAAAGDDWTSTGFEDWESGQDFWNVIGGQWQVGEPTYSSGPSGAYSGVACAGTDLSGPTDVGADARLVSPPTELGSGESVYLSFRHWYQLGTGSGAPDSAFVELRVDGDPWQRVSTVFLGGSRVWSRHLVDLSAFAGRRVEIAFRFLGRASTPRSGWYVDDIELVERPLVFENPNDFELGLGDWYASHGQWQVGEPTYSSGPSDAYSGVACAGTDLAGPTDVGADARLVSPPTELGSGEWVYLSFRHWYQLGTGSGAPDSAFVELRVDGDPWQRVSTVFLGSSRVWSRHLVDLSAFAGRRVEIAFRFLGRASTPRSGWYVDDIELVERPLVFENPNDFELGLGDWYASHGQWQVGEPTYGSGPSGAHSGITCAGTDLAGATDFGTDSRLVSPPIQLLPNTLSDPIRLSFWHWYWFGTGSGAPDSAWVEVRRLAGNWNRASDEFVGASRVWTRHTVELTEYAGDSVQVAFRFRGNASVSRSGWYIDDLVMSGVGGTFTSSVDFGTVSLGRSTALPLTLYNFSSVPVPIVAYELQSSDFSLSESFRDSIDAGKAVVPAHASLSTRLAFLPLDSGARVDTLRFEDDTGARYAEYALSGWAPELRFNVLTGTLYPDGEIDADDDLFVPVQIAESLAVDSIRVSYSPSGSHALTHKRLQLAGRDDGIDTYVAQVPLEGAIPIGLQLAVTAHTGPVVVREPETGFQHLRIRTSDVAFPGTLPAGRYCMISAPIELVSRSVLGLFGDDLGPVDPARWRMFAYDPTRGYVEMPSNGFEEIEHGRAYWLITESGARLDTSPVMGTTTAADVPFQLTLQPGWNQIGNPFAFPIVWDDVGRSDLGAIGQPVAWNCTEEKYEDDTPEIFEPYVGYFMRNHAEVEQLLTIPPTAFEDATSTSRVQRGLDMQETLRIDAEIDGSSSTVVVGFREGALAGADPLDGELPPRFPDSRIELRIDNRDWERWPGYYRRDVRPDAEDGAVWTLELDSPENRIVELRFTPAPRSTRRYRVVDLERDVTIDVQTHDRYDVAIGSRRPYRLTLLGGDAAFVNEAASGLTPPPPGRPVLAGAVPNPTLGSAVVEFGLPRPARASLTVYDLAGRRVRSVLDDVTRSGGYHAVVWDGNDDAGRRVPAGVYVLRLQVDSVTRTRKLTLLN